MGLEKTRLQLGFIPLTDCAPLVIALENGFFAAEGLDVALSREQSWARIRDKVAFGDLDGAHMLAPMVIATAMGLEPVPEPFLTGMALNLNGNAITVSADLYDRMRQSAPDAVARRPLSAEALKVVIEEDKKVDASPLTFATVFPFSTHNYELRYWLGAAGIHPDRDINIVVTPPPQVVDQLRNGVIDGYCVGEPWNTAAVEAGLGRTLVTSYELWSNGPEKVFGVTHTWAEEHPETHQAVLRALISAACFLDAPGGREAAADILSRSEYLDMPKERLLSSLTGAGRRTGGDAITNMPDFNVFHRYAANFPWLSHAQWFITQMYRWGQAVDAVDIRRIAKAAYRPDLYRLAADAVEANYPLIEEKDEGASQFAWAMDGVRGPIGFGPDAFIDGRTYAVDAPVQYIESFETNSIRASLSELRQANS